MNGKVVGVGTAALALALAACGSDGSNAKGSGQAERDAGTPPPPGTGGSGGQADAPPPPSASGFHELYGYDWSIGPGVEAYYCDYVTLKQDMLVTDFRPLNPSGTHHLVVGYQDPVAPDGHYDEGEGDCTGTSFGDVYLYVATPGTQELAMPAGVAVKIPAGKQLVFGLHVFNAGEAPLSARSGVEVRTVERSAVEQEAEVVAIDKLDLFIPPGKVEQSSTCTMTDDVTLFAVQPHMHLAGAHIKATADLADGGTATLLDKDYAFTDQQYEILDPPVRMKKGGQARQTCTYENPGPNTLTFGEHTATGEMCITFAYRYPAVAINAPRNSDFGGVALSNCLE